MTRESLISSVGYLWACLPLLILPAVVNAEKVPDRGAVDSRIRTAHYNADEVYRLHGYVGYGIELVFEEGELYVGQAGGDLEAITVGAHENHLILKPRASNVGTNFVVYTDRRAYRFDYTVSPTSPDPRNDEVIYAVRFIYPPSPPEPTRDEQVELEFTAAALSRSRNIDYWFCGHHTLRPVAVFDDGVHTRLTFGAKSELPALFVRNEDGSESLLNFSVDGGDVVIHRVARQVIVRRGRLTGCIVNKGYVGSGERLESGTVAPTVLRERKELRP